MFCNIYGYIFMISNYYIVINIFGKFINKKSLLLSQNLLSLEKEN